jgi:hypothetical protein
MPQRPTQREFLVAESSVEVRAWQDQRTLDLVPPLASSDQFRHLGSSYETQYKQESAICEMGFNGNLAQQQFWEAHVRFGSWPCQNVLPEEVGLGEVVTEANFPDLDYARIAAISG